MKVWSVRIFILDQDGNEHEAKAFNKVTYNLHPSFENPNQSRPSLPARRVRSAPP
jgi:transcription initiation factor IIF auxiliary subunit